MTDTTETVVVEEATPVVEETATVVEPTEPTTETVVEPTDDVLINLSEDELNAIAEQFKVNPTEPAFFPGDKKEEEGDDLSEAFKQIDVLISNQVEKEQLIKEKDESMAKVAADIDNLKAELSDKSQFVETFQAFYSKLNEYMDTEMIDAIGAGEKDKVPLHFIPENMKRVLDNPVVGPLVQGLLKGETIDIPKLIIETVKSKQASLPRAAAPTVKPVDSATTRNPMAEISRMNRAMNGMK